METVEGLPLILLSCDEQRKGSVGQRRCRSNFMALATRRLTSRAHVPLLRCLEVCVGPNPLFRVVCKEGAKIVRDTEGRGKTGGPGRTSDRVLRLGKTLVGSLARPQVRLRVRLLQHSLYRRSARKKGQRCILNNSAYANATATHHFPSDTIHSAPAQPPRSPSRPPSCTTRYSSSDPPDT